MPALPTLPTPKVPGLLKGLKVTLKTMLTPAVTQQYPHEKPDLAPRTRGVIALMTENCTVCMLCGRECPDWCIYIESHKERVPPAKPGGRERTRNQLDRFAIDFALCMYCGICIEVCPFDALFWSPEFEYSTYTIAELTHEQGRLREWMDTVPPPPPLEEGADQPQEIAQALEAVEKQRERALEEQAKRAQQAADADVQQETTKAKRGAEEEEIEVEAQVDQETYDKLIEEGKSERVARARAKAAYVRREKARIRKEREASAGGTDAEREEQAAQEPDEQPTADATAEAAPADAATAEAAEPEPQEAEEIHVEGGEIDQETYDELIEEGKSERVARARAKAAYVRKEKARIRKEREGSAGGTDGEREEEGSG